jgi:hypothetical protein
VLWQANANLKADTTEVLLGRKKQMHIAAFTYRVDEISLELQVSIASFRWDELSAVRMKNRFRVFEFLKSRQKIVVGQNLFTICFDFCRRLVVKS